MNFCILFVLNILPVFRIFMQRDIYAEQYGFISFLYGFIWAVQKFMTDFQMKFCSNKYF